MSSPREPDVMTTRRRCRQLLSLSYPKPLLQKLKVEKSRQTPQEPNSSNNDNGASKSDTEEEGECFVCSSRPADDSFLAGLSIGQLQLLSNVFAPPTDSNNGVEVSWNWKFCFDCLSIIRRLLNLKEEMEDITLKIKTVLKLRYQCLDSSDIKNDVHLNNSYDVEDIAALSGPAEGDVDDSNLMDAEVEIPMSLVFSETSLNSELNPDPDAPSESEPEPCEVDDPRGCHQDVKDVGKVQEEDANQNHVVESEIVEPEPVVSKRKQMLKLHCKICRKHFTDIWKFKRHMTSLAHEVRTKTSKERLTPVNVVSAPSVVDVQQIDDPLPQHNAEVSMTKPGEAEGVNKDGEDKVAEENPTTIEPRPKRASRFRAEQMIKSLSSRNNCNGEDHDSTSECPYSSSDDDGASPYDNDDDFHMDRLDDEHINGDPVAVSSNRMGRRIYHCKICIKDFPGKWKFNRHMESRLHAASETFDSEPGCTDSDDIIVNDDKRDSDPDPQPVHPVERRIHHCKICGIDYSSEQELIRHWGTQLHKTNKISSTKSEHTSEGHNLHSKESHVDKLHEKQDPTSVGKLDRSCKLCRKNYKDRRKLMRHRRVHHGFKVHGELKKCPRCDEVFYLQYLFDAHTHFDDGSIGYVCSICNRTASQRYGFKQHMATHRRTTNCQCEMCGKVFVTPSALKLHKMTVHVSHDERVTCSICKNIFSSKIERVDHERVVHKGLPSLRCYFCSKYCQPARILPHMLTHTKEKTLYCTVCRKKFSSPLNLKAHCDAVCGSDEAARDKVRKQKREMMRKYRAKLHYSCSFCSMKFAQKPQLETHVQRQHFEDNLLMTISV